MTWQLLYRWLALINTTTVQIFNNRALIWGTAIQRADEIGFASIGAPHLLTPFATLPIRPFIRVGGIAPFDLISR
jgi:hypothetical protein